MAQCRDDLQRSLSMKRATPSRVRSSNRRSFWVPRPSVWEKKFRRKSTGRKERSCWVGPQQGRSEGLCPSPGTPLPSHNSRLPAWAVRGL